MLADTLMQFNSQSAHAYLVFGDRQRGEQQLEEYFSRMGIDTHQNPDVFFFSKKQCGIGEVRSITSIVSKTNAQMEKKYIVISTDAITIEAQNALLKTIEEPESPTIFFILLPEGGYVLETVRSRVQIITQAGGDQYQTLITNYLQSTFAERMELLEVFYTEGEKDKKPTIQKGRLSSFLNELERRISTFIQDHVVDSDVHQDYMEITQYVLDRSANTKQILEYISMRLPMIK